MCWTIENNYILSGSEETNIRIWKADPARKLGPVGKREERAINYRKKLVDKFKFNRKIKDLKKTHLPKYLLTAKRKKQLMSEARHRKIENMQANGTAGLELLTRPEKEKKFVKLVE